MSAQDQKNINIQRLGVEDGLSHYTINSIYEDEFGFIWVGTKDGLNRYNGRTIEVFKPVRGSRISLSENNIRYVCGDRNGHLFIKGLESVTEFDLRTQTFKVIAESNVSAIYFAKGFLWLVKGNNIYKYNSQSKKQKLYFSLNTLRVSNFPISFFSVGANGTLHLAGVGQGYFQISPSLKIVHRLTMIQTVKSVVEDTKGNIWLATINQGLYCLANNKSLQHYETSAALGNNLMKAICEDPSGNLFIATYGGLFKFDVSTQRFTELKYPFKRTGLNLRSITTLMFDRQGTLWLGTFFEGLHRYNPGYDTYKYHHLANEVDQKRYPIVNSMVEDKYGRLWFGTESEGLNVLNPRNNNARTFRKGQIASDVIKSLCYDQTNNMVWAATLRNGIDRINPDNWQITHIPNIILDQQSRPDGNAENIVKMFSRGDSLFLCTNSGLAVLNKKTNVITRFNSRFSPNYIKQVWDVNVDNQSNLWLCYSMDILKISLKNGRLKRYTFKEIAGSSVNSSINVMLYDSRQRLWIGSTGSGFYRYNPDSDKFTNYNSTHGLGNDYVTGLAEDKTTGNLYISTHDGISKFNPATGIAENFNLKNGFPFSVIDDNSLFFTRQGRLYASGYSGLISIDAKDLRDRVQDYQVYVTGIAVDNKHVVPNDESNILQQTVLYQKNIVLRPEHSIISFDFATNNLLNSKFSQLEYKLEGFDAHFIRADNSHVASYTNLNPGKYTFEVRGVAANKSGKQPAVALELVVLPPFYRTWWFALLVILAVVSITIYFVRSYVRGINLQASLNSEKREKEHVEQVNQSKLRFFTNVAHEFRTPLTLINSQLEILLQQADLSAEQQTKIRSAYQNALKMRKLADEIIDFRKQELGLTKLKLQEQNVVSFLRQIYQSFIEYAATKNIAFNFVSNENGITGFIDAEQFEKVINNLLSNAFKYTRPGDTISVEVTQQNTSIVINVRDNGLGITADHIDHIFENFYQDDQVNAQINLSGSGIGLYYAKAIVDLHGGNITVSSVPQTETVFTVTIPLASSSLAHLVAGFGTDGNQTIKSDIEWSTAEEEVSTTVLVDSPRMLIVEDNTELREMLVGIFQSIYQVKSAPNGKEGIEQTEQWQPDIILSDVVMPEMSGTEMCALIKGKFETCHIPVVLLTARTADEHIVDGLQTGADDYVVKPFSVKQLVARCQNLIAGRKRLQEKYRHTPDAPVSILSNNDIDNTLLTNAVTFISSHLDHPDFNLKLLANELGLSRTAMFAKIKGLTGQTPNDFINTIRLKRAVEILLSTPDITSAEIAYQVGFSSPSYFIKCFKDTYGTTPAAYKKVK